MRTDYGDAIIRALIPFAGSLLVACQGDAPALTCHHGCQAGYHRDIFCVCQKDQPPGTGGDGVVPQPRAAELDFEFAQHPQCGLDPKAFLLNFAPRRLVVTVTWFEPGYERKYQDYTIEASRTRREDGIYLGWEYVYDPSSAFCFNRDFSISSFRDANLANATQSAMARLSEQTKPMLTAKSQLEARMQTMTIMSAAKSKGLSPQSAQGPKIEYLKDSKVTQQEIKVEPLDCVQTCDSGDTLRCAIRGYPPDQTKLKAMRDKLRAPIAEAQYAAADIYSIFGLKKESCARTDIFLVGKQLFNTGQYCSFPLYLNESDKRPSIALHLPQAVKGERITLDNQTSGIVFNAGVGAPTLLFAEPDLNNYGGVVMDAVAGEKGIYYQTPGGCIFLGVK